MHSRDSEAALAQIRKWNARVGVVLGSGLNGLVEDVPADRVIPYANFPQLPKITVPGHLGQFVLGELGGQRAIFAQGRVHMYEGRSVSDVTGFVRLLAEAGVKTLILTNAAGSLRPDFEPGQWMILNDHINLTGTSPLIGAPEFVDMSETYSPRLREGFKRGAVKLKSVLHEGVYAGLIGPQYETPAEVRMLQKLGADAVGMSTVLEAIQARALGLEVAAFSCLTNFAAGISATKLSHADVLETGKTATNTLAQLLTAAIPAIAS